MLIFGWGALVIRILAIAATLALGACAIAEKTANGLTAAVLNQNDPATVREGMPAYLLLIDGTIHGDPENSQLLFAGAKLYGSFAGQFVEDENRAQRLAERALGYARRGLCEELYDICQALDGRADVLAPLLAEVDEDDAIALYDFASTWATWLQLNSGDWAAIGQIPKIRMMMERVAALIPNHDHGNVYLYLGVMATQIPPAMGGKPEEGKAFFEQAVLRSDGRNLMAKVLFAENYARLVFDQALHDGLLQEVLAADPQSEGLTLINVLAQQKAQELVESGKEYF